MGVATWSHPGLILQSAGYCVNYASDCVCVWGGGGGSFFRNTRVSNSLDPE